MGLKTLEMFRADLQLGLGNRGFEVTQLNGWINTAIQDLTSQKEFSELEGASVESALASENSFTPVDTEGILEIANVTDKIAMVRIEEARWVRLDQTVTGEPRLWYRSGDIIKFWPTAEKDMDFSLELQGNQNVFTDDLATTNLMPMWDRAIHLLSMSHALTDLEEPNRAMYFLQVSQQYVAMRIDLTDMDGRSTGEPVQPIESFEQLRRQRQNDSLGLGY